MPKETDLTRLDSVLSKHKDQEGALIPVLQEAQEIYGYLPEEVLSTIGKRLHVPMSGFMVWLLLRTILSDAPRSPYGMGLPGLLVTFEVEGLSSMW
jgi:hypothetical protein